MCPWIAVYNPVNGEGKFIHFTHFFLTLLFAIDYFGCKKYKHIIAPLVK
jgi:hypothetical protein